MLVRLAPKITNLATLGNADDVSGSLRVKDVFSWYFIPKLERLYGEPKAQIIFMGVITGMGGAFNLLMSLLEIISFFIAGLLTVLLFACSIAMYHYQRDRQSGKWLN